MGLINVYMYFRSFGRNVKYVKANNFGLTAYKQTGQKQENKKNKNEDYKIAITVKILYIHLKHGKICYCIITVGEKISFN